MKVILSHSGKQHSYQVARALKSLNHLEKFYTSSYITSKSLQNFFERRGNSFWSRRFLTGLYGDKVEANWNFEFKEILYRKIFGQDYRALNLVYERDTKFDNYLAKKIPKINGEIFWGFQGSSYESLKAAKSSGKIAICELATAHVLAAQKILGEEQNLHPEWADSIDNLNFPKDYGKRLEMEPQIADYVIGASEFTLKTLRESGISENKIKYLPLGFDINYIPYTERGRKKESDSPLKILYAGKVTQRKGVKYLLEAFKKFQNENIELHLIGGIQGSGTALKQYKNLFTYHPPVHQYELYKMYNNFDAFILPSLFEGFGLVIVEALAAGLPVITTPNTMGPEIIIQDKNGYIVPIRDISSIQIALEKLLLKSKEEIFQMKLNARRSAESFSWGSYQNKLKFVINSIHHGN